MNSRQKGAIAFTIYGEPTSMKNSRKIVKFGNRPGLSKSDKARQYEADVIAQVRPLPRLLKGDLSVTMTLYYASRRPDLCEALILDCLQGRIYKNDRQVKEKHVRWALDKQNPRAEISIQEVE